MSKVKDILGIVVRSITKRILGTNVPHMPKADGTLLYHLKRIKDGVNAAYDALDERGIVLSSPKNIDNLWLNIKNSSISFIKVILNDGSEKEFTSLGEIALSGGIAGKVIEIYDDATTFQTLNKPWGNKDDKTIKTLFPNVSKITFAKEEEISRDYKDLQGNGYFNSAMIPSNVFKVVTHYIKSFGTFSRSTNYYIYKDSTIEEVNLPYLESEINTSTITIYNASALKLINMPNCKLVGSIVDCTVLETINFPRNESTDRADGIVNNCSSLKHVILPACTVLGGNFNNNKKMITNCPLVEDIVLGKITALRYINGISNTALDFLNKFEVGEGTERVCELNAWTASSVEDELLNGNFKTYFAERLATWTDGSVHTLTFCQSFYDRLTEENKTILANKGWTIAIAELE